MRIVIIGAGECGTRTAIRLREAGFAGEIQLVNGEVYSPYERPPLSKSLQSPLSLTPISRSRELAEIGVTLHSGVTASAVDRSQRIVTLSNGAHLPFDRLLIATGARARRFAPAGKEPTSIAYLRTFDDAAAIYNQIKPELHLVIIGGGFIGLELAAVARTAGANVTVIETQARVLARAVPADIAAVIENRHRVAGVEFVLETGIAAISDDRVITLTSGQSIAADLIVAGIGSVPETALAEAAGLTIDNGIAVDSHFMTSDPEIFAAGDCCSFPHPIYDGKRIRIESWRAAQQQGTFVADAMLGNEAPYAAIPWFWSDQYDLSLQIVGVPSDGTSIIRRDLDGGAFLLFHLADDGRLVAASGIGIGNAVARDIRLAEMLIERLAKPAEADLADPSVKLKALLTTRP